MKNIAGIIAEYNPFHNGHDYQLQQVKKAGADGIVICMSGNYVQRCEPALLEKHRRAEIAVKNCRFRIIFFRLRLLHQPAVGCYLLPVLFHRFISAGKKRKFLFWKTAIGRFVKRNPAEIFRR